jgi:hypothetical protein
MKSYYVSRLWGDTRYRYVRFKTLKRAIRDMQVYESKRATKEEIRRAA